MPHIIPRQPSSKLARALYAQHSVEAIARYDAGAQNLRVTSRRIEELVDDARERQRKVDLFCHGCSRSRQDSCRSECSHSTTRRGSTDACRLSFRKRPACRCAARSTHSRRSCAAESIAAFEYAKGKVGESVKAFIQNVHHFRDDLLNDAGPPAEHVTIFDEAQRAWNLNENRELHAAKKESCRVFPIRAGISDFVHGSARGLGCHRLSCRRRTRDQHGRSRNRFMD